MGVKTMHHRYTSLALLTASILLALILSLQAAGPTAAAQPQEAPLNPLGWAFEINIAADGHLLISDYDAGEIWRVDPATATYTVFTGIETPSDARAGNTGSIWWADGEAARFGRLDPGSKKVTWWTVPADAGLLGTQIDAAGSFWAAAIGEPLLFQFQPGAGRLCTYTLPGEGQVDYPLARDPFIWLGDAANGHMLRLDPQTNRYTRWQLPPGSTPFGLAADDGGGIWYADPNNAALARLDPSAGSLAVYDLPAGSLPALLAARGGDIWYTEQGDGALGRLVPGAAQSTTFALPKDTIAASRSCATISPHASETVAARTGQLAWAGQEYPLLANTPGWRIYQLPAGAYPWGVALNADHTWFIDGGRQVLGRIPFEAPVAITACKLLDADGDLATSSDQTPLPGWTLYLRVAGQRQGPGLPTADDGCARWAGLAGGLVYGVEEQLLPGWLALTGTAHDFPPAGPGVTLQHTFINAHNIFPSAQTYLPVTIR